MPRKVIFGIGIDVRVFWHPFHMSNCFILFVQSRSHSHHLAMLPTLLVDDDLRHEAHPSSLFPLPPIPQIQIHKQSNTPRPASIYSKKKQKYLHARRQWTITPLCGALPDAGLGQGQPESVCFQRWFLPADSSIEHHCKFCLGTNKRAIDDVIGILYQSAFLSMSLNRSYTWWSSSAQLRRTAKVRSAVKTAPKDLDGPTLLQGKTNHPGAMWTPDGGKYFLVSILLPCRQN